MKFRKTLTRTAAFLLSAALLGALGTAEYYSSRLPSVITKEAGGELRIAEYPEISCCGTPTTGKLPSEGTRATLSLFGAIPVKSVSVHEAEAPVLAAGGDPFGIKLLMDGVMVTELSPVAHFLYALIGRGDDSYIHVDDLIVADPPYLFLL